MRSFFGGSAKGHIEAEQLSAYLDHQAPPAERARIHAHLQQCPDCRAELESLRQTVQLLQALPRVSVPHAFTLSQAQVGVRRPAGAAPVWLGGLVRGLGAATAVAVVALVAFAVLRPEDQPWRPNQSIARVAPTAAPAVEAQPLAMEAPGGSAAATDQDAVAALPTLIVEAAPVEAPALSATAATAAPVEPAPAEPAPAAMIAMAPAPAEEPTRVEEEVVASAAAPEPMATEAPAMTAKAAPAEPAPVEPVMSAPALAEAVPPAAAAAFGRGGGGPEEPVGIPSEMLTPEPAPPAQPLATALPHGIRFAYADLNALWAVDRDGGTRQLVQARGINTPQLSPDESWIAYQIAGGQGLQVWAVRWAGGQPKLLLDDANLPTDRLPSGYQRRAIRETRWEPQGSTLSVTLSLVPGPDQPNLLPKTELWRVNVETGALRYVSELGQVNQPYYSPDGSRYLLVQYGTETKPEGSISLHDAATGKGRTVVTFPASPGKASYDSQVAWTPDSKAAWVAIPEADYGLPSPPNGATLYRVSAAGKGERVGQIDAFQAYWSPGGDLLAYTRFISESLATSELYLAESDGASPQLYATMSQGEFISWSPEGERFLYQDAFEMYVGQPDEAPQRLTNSVSMVGPRWVSDSQVMALHDTGDGWLLTLRDVDGTAVSLLPVVREAMWDVGY